MGGIDTKQRIFRAALKVFAKQGYHGTSMRAIAQLARLTKPALYYHFKNKQDLFRQLIEISFSSFKRKLDQDLPKTGPLTSRLADVLFYEFKYCQENKDLVRLAYSLFLLPPAARLHIDFLKMDQTYFHHIEDLLLEATGSTRKVAQQAARMIKGLAEQTILHMLFAKLPINQRQVARMIPRVVLNGMGLTDTGRKKQ